MHYEASRAEQLARCSEVEFAALAEVAMRPEVASRDGGAFGASAFMQHCFDEPLQSGRRSPALFPYRGIGGYGVGLFCCGDPGTGERVVRKCRGGVFSFGVQRQLQRAQRTGEVPEFPACVRHAARGYEWQSACA